MEFASDQDRVKYCQQFVANVLKEHSYMPRVATPQSIKDLRDLRKNYEKGKVDKYDFDAAMRAADKENPGLIERFDKHNKNTFYNYEGYAYGGVTTGFSVLGTIMAAKVGIVAIGSLTAAALPLTAGVAVWAAHRMYTNRVEIAERLGAYKVSDTVKEKLGKAFKTITGAIKRAQAELPSPEIGAIRLDAADLKRRFGISQEHSPRTDLPNEAKLAAEILSNSVDSVVYTKLQNRDATQISLSDLQTAIDAEFEKLSPAVQKIIPKVTLIQDVTEAMSQSGKGSFDGKVRAQTIMDYLKKADVEKGISGPSLG
ncbi:hypothetical protein ACYPKM_00735 [Pseudomonas aeruginosa]